MRKVITDIRSMATGLRLNARTLTAAIMLAWTGISANNTWASGAVLPPTAAPKGYSLRDMAAKVANFSISGNDVAFYPDTPFQILYRLGNLQDPTGQNTFHVRPGTFIYVKYFFIDDSAPIIGDWPADNAGAGEYILGRDQIGGHGMQIDVDGQAYSLDDPGYVGGPVPTPDSPDGSEHMIQVGAFLTPLSKGVHKVTASGTFDGAAFVDFVGIPISLTITYTVIVE
jgi:hypothetical protein